MLRPDRADLTGLKTNMVELKERVGFVEGQTASILVASTASAEMSS